MKIEQESLEKFVLRLAGVMSMLPRNPMNPKAGFMDVMIDRAGYQDLLAALEDLDRVAQVLEVKA